MSPTAATKVLVIGYVWPEPRSSAASGHLMQILQVLLGQGWDITFSSPANPGEHKEDLSALGIRECPIELNNSSFDRFIAELAPDIVLFDQFMMEEQFGWRVEQQCPGALRVLETSDLQSLRHARHQRLKKRLGACDDNDDFSALFAPAAEQEFAGMAETDQARREIAALYRCDLSLMISEFEIDLLVKQFGLPPALLHWCPLMPEQMPHSYVPFAERAHFLSIGNFRHAPNWDAVLWMKSAVWPLIRQQLPGAQLHIYGAYTPPKAAALHNPAQGFQVMNWAEDALEVMSAARICLAPLRFGAGIKGKLLDAMLCGTPSVTTPVGAEAMHGDAPWPGAVAESASAIAAAAVRLYQDQALWSAAQEQGRQLLLARYRQQVHGPALIERLQHCRANLAQLRRDNFTGGMLRHHHHKSTQYMAQWIEAKNRLA
ncbi:MULTISPECIES: glycosyltransferase [Pseudomonas]|uniref:glycosyltransferase n=1 Tax=Pseudomonas TaxID=286 RepID=UPI00030012BE|nr:MULTISPECIES: glycosyltransferase [Pseudomonas]AZD92878.1 Glycosyltransferase [Pseudomonas chlororaphis subsp. aureofaciens]AZD99324.1 Glycosyltransferase [Pseudomonas chlororaphis subsp. aureofaciens]AZE05508.1 Glycosyltransferase [Pseudomonas chlororaphis subsp. aureofaciens]KAA5842886.1 glycosyltransferase [Pseudomonas chlororaphis]KAB0532486.1 glycosyltransferase [Pseudomonas chlororaphis subsp. aureofaciens]